MALTIDRTPYKVFYHKDGQVKNLTRTPPALLHDMEVQDKVVLNRAYNSDFPSEETYEIGHIKPRNANVLFLNGEDGKQAAVPYFDVTLKEKAENDIFAEDRRNKDKDPIGTGYLLWP
jgi:hypothetical protein